LPCDPSELERGAVCLALYPFSTSFPLERIARDAADELLAQLERFETIEELESIIKAGDAPSELVARFKLRRVVVLHDGTQSGIADVAVARVVSVRDERQQTHPKWYSRLQNGAHPTQLLIGQEERHGTSGREAYVDGLYIALIPKATILRRVGKLDEDEMSELSKRLVTAFEIDV
jgi:hypothetical protein